MVTGFDCIEDTKYTERRAKQPRGSSGMYLRLHNPFGHLESNYQLVCTQIWVENNAYVE